MCKKSRAFVATLAIMLALGLSFAVLNGTVLLEGLAIVCLSAYFAGRAMHAYKSRWSNVVDGDTIEVQSGKDVSPRRVVDAAQHSAAIALMVSIPASVLGMSLAVLSMAFLTTGTASAALFIISFSLLAACGAMLAPFGQSKKHN